MPLAQYARPSELVAAAIDYVALEGSDGIAVSDLMDAIDSARDPRMRRQVWLLLRRQHARGVLQFYYMVTPPPPSTTANTSANGTSASTSAGKKRKRPTGSNEPAPGNTSNLPPITSTSSTTTELTTEGNRNRADSGSHDSYANDGDDDVNMDDATDEPHTATANESHIARAIDEEDGPTRPLPHPPTSAPPPPPLAHAEAAGIRREPVEDAESIAYEDACPIGLTTTSTSGAAAGVAAASAGFPLRRKRLHVVACEELRFRALNIPKRAILAEFGDDHVRILEAVGRARTNGITIPALCDVFTKATSVKKVHNSLDTLISYNLVVKRMMIVAKPAMRRLNIVHLPRFAASFTPEMYDYSAEFESDDQCKKILSSAAAGYLKELPTKSSVLYDLGRDLGFQKRHLEVLKSHIIQEAKRDENFHLELFQAVLQPPKKGNTSVEPKILNCVRYRGPPAAAAAAATDRNNSNSTESNSRGNGGGMCVEVGLLHQIYGAIEENGDSGTTIIDLRNKMVLPGNKLPYKLVSILAGTYGLRAEAIILGKNKAFKLYPMLPKGGRVRDNKQLQANGFDGDDGDGDADEEITVIPSAAKVTKTTSPSLSDDVRYRRVVPVGSAGGGAAAAGGGGDGTDDNPQREELFSVRANLALKVALGGIEVEGTRARRRGHILERLLSEKIISLSSLRASIVTMEKKLAADDAASSTTREGDGTHTSPAYVGMVDTRSVSRIANEMEHEGALRLLQLPLPPRNVSTKFRALRCVVLPGYEANDVFLQEFVKNYGRDERLRRIQSNTDKNEIVRLRAIDSEDEDVPGFTLFRRPRKRTRVEMDGGPAALLPSPAAAIAARCAVLPSSGSLTGTHHDEPPPTTEISYRVRSFVSQDKTHLHAHQYRRLGFAYGVMFRAKQLHHFLWRFLHDHPEIHLRDEEIDISIDDDDDATANTNANTNTNTNGPTGENDKVEQPQLQPALPRRPLERGVVFSRETVLHRMPVYLYILAFSGGAVLTPSEFVQVEDAVHAKQTFDALPQQICAKIWAHESGRTAKVLGTLSDLQLIVPHKIGMKNLIKILRAGYTDDRDSILAQALKDNALGGLFRLRNSIRITLDDSHSGLPSSSGDNQDRAINNQSVLKLVGTTERSFSFGRLLPLQHTFTTSEDVELYWEAMEGLCLERMVMEVPNPKPNEPLVCQVPLPVKSRARRMFRILAWIPKAQKMVSNKPASEQAKLAKRTGIVSRVVRTCRKRGPRVLKKTKTNSSTSAATNATTIARRRRSTSSSMDGGQYEDENDENDGDEEDEAGLFAWSDDDERQLIDYYIENCRSRWKTTIPQGIQRDGENVAFRIPFLSRSGFGLVSIARKLGKRKIDVKKRLKEKLTEPDAKLLLEDAKREMTESLNPTGKFDEEISIFQSPRMAALFRRAVMMIASPQDEYHPLVAEELISFWKADEIRLVWRYLWLKNWIVRATDRERVRGYSMSQKLQDFLKLTTLTHPIALFHQAAEQEAMVSSTLDEVGEAGSHEIMMSFSSKGMNQNDTSFEAEFPPDATPGQCALELACQVMGLCRLVPIHSPIVEATGSTTNGDDDDEEDPAKKAAGIQLARKRTLRFLNYKNQKESTGFTAHLSKRITFKNPAVLTENWHVETKMTAVTLDDPTQYRQFEAFSTVHENEYDHHDSHDNSSTMATHSRRPAKRAKMARRALSELVEQAVRTAGEQGASLSDVMARVRGGQRAEVTTTRLVESCLATLVESGVVVCVNAYFSQRYIIKDHGDLWLLRPYTLVAAAAPDETSTTATTTPKIVFDGDKDLLSFPWLKMDGSTNHRFLFSIQRKVLSYVLVSPGITEQTVYFRLDKLLTLQDTREALALLVEDGLIYARATTRPLQGGPLSLFGGGGREGGGRAFPGRPSIELVDVTTTNVLQVDRSRSTVHYFPHVECIQRFGSIIQDDQNERESVP